MNLTYLLNGKDISSTCNPHWYWQEMQHFFYTSSTSSRKEEKNKLPLYWRELLLCQSLILPRQIKILWGYLCKNYLCFTDGVCETDSGGLFNSLTSKICRNSNSVCIILCCMILPMLDPTLKLVLLWMGGWMKWPPDIFSNLAVALWFLFSFTSFNFAAWTYKSLCRFQTPDTTYW